MARPKKKMHYNSAETKQQEWHWILLAKIIEFIVSKKEKTKDKQHTAL